MKHEDRILSLRIGFPISFFCVFLLFSTICAVGDAAGLKKTDSLGAALLNAFGGCVWSEEVDIHEILNWMVDFIPSGIAACIVLSHRLSGLLYLEGYRYPGVLRWYISLFIHVLVTVCIVVFVQILLVLLFAAFSGHTGWSVWVYDADEFSVQNTLQPCLAPLLFWLYAEVIALNAAVVYMIFRKMIWYYAAFFLPSILGAVVFSHPGKSSLFNPIHFGMAHRLSIEGSYGVNPAAACGGLLLILLLIFAAGGCYCRFSSPFDCAYE